MKTWMIGAAIAALVVLLGCTSDQEKLANAQAAKAQQAAADDAQCQSYGVRPGSDAYVSCRMQLDNRQAQADELRRQRALQMLMNNQNQQQAVQPYQLPKQVNCTSSTYGQTTNTNCH